MGIFKMFGGSSCRHDEPKETIIYVDRSSANNNPNPRNFSIRKTHEVEGFLIAKVLYPDCINYEGSKILVFENVSKKELQSLTFLDPHFCRGGHVSPVARFEPTEKGWEDALLYVHALRNRSPRFLFPADKFWEKYFEKSILWETVKESIGSLTPTVFWKTLIDPYLEKGRYYHDLTHIKNMLLEFESIRHLLTDPVAVEGAIWIHDAVMDFRKFDNEIMSARKGGEVFGKLGKEKLSDKRVTRLVLVTDHKTKPNNNDEKYMVDMDLAIFGQSEKMFDLYEKNIEREYSFLPKETFVYYRKKVIEKFLDRKSIYHTDEFRKKYEQKARKNLKRSMAKLNSQ